MFGPLEFSSNIEKKDEIEEKKMYCVLCQRTFDFPSKQKDCLSHVFETHKLIIADVHLIGDLKKYFEFWRQRFLEAPLDQFCTKIVVDIKKDGLSLNDGEYYLLSDVNDEDKYVRENLQTEKLENALHQQKLEREDTNYEHDCLFCRQVIKPTRCEYLKHLLHQHNLHLGQPDNLVYVDELITTIQHKMEVLQCIFCEKFFKDRNVLKEHMRKKMHKRINPDNELYDKFFIGNYIGPDNMWKKERKRRDSYDEHEPCDWSDWQEKLTLSTFCLFCRDTFASWDNILNHMKHKHNFDYSENTSEMDFYDQVKLVNYIRLQSYRNRCIYCNSEFTNCDETLEHKLTMNHNGVPSKQLWNQPKFYFPTYENDAFLCQIDDNINENDEEVNSELPAKLSNINFQNVQDIFDG